MLDHPGEYIARLPALEHPTVYVLVGDTLAEVQAMLPPGLDLSLQSITRRLPHCRGS